MIFSARQLRFLKTAGEKVRMVGENIKFVFICPMQSKMFESSDFKIVDNKGVTTDEIGNKTLNAKVALNEPCPHCGRKHVYQAGEIACPFENSEGQRNF